MAFDGAFLHTIKQEIEEHVLDARIDKIHQPSKEMLVIVLRFRGGSKKLLINMGANSPRIHFTEYAPENPKTPPMFCMFLRKHLGSGKLLAVRQLELDRVLYLDFETTNELGDAITITLAVEIMGRHSNLIVIGQDGKVLDSIKRVDDSMSGVRRVLPGVEYTSPPLQDKLNILAVDNGQIFERIRTAKDAELSKCLLGVLQGISPLLAREIAFYVTRGEELAASQLSEEHYSRLDFYCGNLRKILQERDTNFTMVLEHTKPKDFSFVDIHQYGTYMLTKSFPTASHLLDGFYSERDLQDRMKQRSGDLLKLLVNTSDRIARKLETQKQELKQSTKRDMFRVYGDLINANLYQMQKGDSSVRLLNFYDEAGQEVEIPLDIRLTPVQNAQKYYNDYKKSVHAEKMLTELIVSSAEELTYIESVFDSLTRAVTEDELMEIRQELAEQGYIKNYKNRYKQAKAQKPLRYQSSDGYTIYCGRNNKQNDKLTTKDARNYDMWFHTQKIPGSHVIVVSQGEEIPKKTLEEACIIAAYNSKARESSKVAVDYTIIKNVKKPNGAKPGMVIFDHYETAYVAPDKELVEKLRIS